MSEKVVLVNTTEDPLHFPHIGSFAPKGDKDGKDKLEVSEQDAEILLRNKALKRVATGGVIKKPDAVKGVTHDRSMKGIERD